MDIVKVSGLTKNYKEAAALNRVDFSLQKEKITALIGPNGAGKSTLVKCLMGLVRYDEGSILVNELGVEREEVRKDIAYLPEKFNFYPFYTVENTMKFFANMRGHELENRQLEDALTKLNILDLRKKKMKELSKGQMQRVALSSMLVSKCNVFIFDEPFSGLDPLGIRDVKALFLSLKEQGATVLINTHVLSEMEQVCDNVVLINKGKILYSGTMEGEISQMGLENFFVKKVEAE